MRLLGALLAGVLAGAIGMVLWFTLDPDWEGGSGASGRGQGNITVSFDERALATIVAEELSWLEASSGPSAIDVEVHSDGRLAISLRSGLSTSGTRVSVVLDPDVEDGNLRMRVVDAVSAGSGLPEAVAGELGDELRGRVGAAVGGRSYRLAAIRTVERRLSFDLVLE